MKNSLQDCAKAGITILVFTFCMAWAGSVIMGRIETVNRKPTVNSNPTVYFTPESGKQK